MRKIDCWSCKDRGCSRCSIVDYELPPNMNLPLWAVYQNIRWIPEHNYQFGFFIVETYVKNTVTKELKVEDCRIIQGFIAATHKKQLLWHQTREKYNGQSNQPNNR